MLKPAFIREQALALYPDLVTLTLQRKSTIGSSGETFGTGVSWQGRPRDVSIEEVMTISGNISTQMRWWELVEDGQTEMPVNGSRVLEADGTVWVVQTVFPTAMQVVQRCLCVREYEEEE